MLKDLICKAKEFGLEAHEDKTKILWNGWGKGATSNSLDIEGRSFEILPTDKSTMYLGRLLNIADPQDVELKNRISKAWSKFAVYRDELTSKYYPLFQRMKVFASVVQPTFLYGCSSWTMTRDREAQVRSLQRKMLRQIVGVRRVVSEERVLEDWLPWFRHATHVAEEARVNHNVPDWVDEVSRRKFRWAGHVARRTDERWTRVFLLQWYVAGCRCQGRPQARWCDSINRFFGGGSDSWIQKAQDRLFWKQKEDDYVYFCAR